MPEPHAGALASDLYDHPDLYDALFPARAHQRYYVELAEQQGGPVLELACGTGQLAVPIAVAGLPIVGLDLSRPMLTGARSRASAAGVGVDFVEADMRHFDVDRRFSLVFVARNSLLHLLSADDLLAALKSGQRHLRPNGVFAFDVFNPDVRLLARPRGQRFPLMKATSETLGPLSVEGSHDYDPAAQVDRGTWYISTVERPDAWIVTVLLRSIFPQELPLLLSAAGFEMISRFGDLSRAPFGSESPLQVCLCRAAA
ncbi:MAG TPA: methyltransferase domain-containing protein [Vicinamibacterales bacterium]|nr:methyltransferase domain-containing protein [Vicinamibacterales bacterium]